MLKETFTELLLHYTNDNKLITELWEEIEKRYSGKSRHYHTLTHLENVLEQLTAIKAQIQNWATVLFTLFYHDIVYNTLKSDNEEESANLAEKRMKQLALPATMIENCKMQILATKTHIISPDSDTNYFTDADLSILGQDWETYTHYYKSIRREYSIYPDLVYNPGRKKVLTHFIQMDSIYKTAFFNDKCEVQAKQNIQKELALLTK
jgi:predicted metal-dependent HD superfamily phosphohydrolase